MLQFFATTQEVCGSLWIYITSIVALLNVVVAIRLAFFSQSVVGLVAFMPVAFLPFALGVLAAATGLLQSIEVSVGDLASKENPALLLSWALLPLVLGGAMSTPAYAIASLGRLWLATRGVKRPNLLETSRAELKARKVASDDASLQAYAEYLDASGHRRSR